MFSAALYARVRFLLVHFAHETAGAARIPAFPAPSLSRDNDMQSSGESCRENAATVIASAAKQSILQRKERMDCFVAEPVIGRAFARPVGSSQ